MITVYSPDHQQYAPAVELIDGTFLPTFEKPERVTQILSALERAKLGDIIPPQDFGLDPILSVHDAAYVSFLKTAWSEWTATYRSGDAFATNWMMRHFRDDRIPDAIDGKLGYYSFDASTPVTAGSWNAAIASAHVALTAQSLLQSGHTSAFALCRPPGHHAASDLFGGYCFLNNAAIASQALRDGGAERIVILDVDYHHGNGTQSIFYDRSDVFFISIHADPAQEYPYFLGYADETGFGRGRGYNQNYPLPFGTTWLTYSEALTDAIHQIEHYAPDVIVVSLGLDTFEKDPISWFALTTESYRRMGILIASLNRPTLFVMEGGYAINELGDNAIALLSCFKDYR
jgi:acetoin utilization deacetylase AcuC-like enzyme